MKNEESLQSALSALFLGLALTLPFAAWSGFAVSHLWKWFVVPLGLPAISIFHAAGLTLIATVMTGIPDVNSGRTAWEGLANSVLRGLFIPTLALGAGWAYTLFL